MNTAEKGYLIITAKTRYTDHAFGEKSQNTSRYSVEGRRSAAIAITASPVGERRTNFHVKFLTSAHTIIFLILSYKINTLENWFSIHVN